GVTPDDAATLANSQCRDYTVIQHDPNTGASSTNALFANFTENINSPSDQDGGATINGASPTAPNNGVAIGALSSQTITVCGAGVSTRTITLLVYDNSSGGSLPVFEPGDNSDRGGAI